MTSNLLTSDSIAATPATAAAVATVGMSIHTMTRHGRDLFTPRKPGEVGLIAKTTVTQESHFDKFSHGPGTHLPQLQVTQEATRESRERTPSSPRPPHRRCFATFEYRGTEIVPLFWSRFVPRMCERDTRLRSSIITKVGPPGIQAFPPFPFSPLPPGLFPQCSFP